ncbi:translation initiation factor IF-2 [Azospirillum sp. CT11-132]|uniref:translation initiation factor IF-2 n=1 Tax=unclassified Azospirillum TaxID=2630922 RepID=UPI000D613222|nr:MULTISPECIES: translation initiation factor IF-2 [unclassified Azospirillum]PWC63564.1 translation initiation factor IF-2 [Azospirillum sp. TSH7]PWC67931.1 translation initiation factor IF-2 [Azospirillum sp. TSH20]QCG97512.1 translation initiation factor IF-2 [Azospirillum sp. TSA2s]
MTDSNDQDQKKVLHLTGASKGKLESKKPVETQVRQSFSHGRSKAVTVEVKRKRHVEKGAVPGVADGGAAARQAAQGLPMRGAQGQRPRGGGAPAGRQLTREELESRLRALRGAAAFEEQRRIEAEEEAVRAEARAAEAAARAAEEPEAAPAAPSEAAAPAAAEAPAQAAPEMPPIILDAETLRQRELDEMRAIQEADRKVAEEAERRRKEEEAKRKEAEDAKRRDAEPAPRRDGARDGAGRDGARPAGARPAGDQRPGGAAGRPAADAAPGRTLPGAGAPAPRAVEEEDDNRRKGGRGGAPAKAAPARPAAKAPAGADRRKGTKLTVSQALSDDGGDRTRSLAAVRRARERERLRQMSRQETAKVTRDVVLPEVITVQELANRMAERGADVIKALMRMGVMATINQTIDADTAELVITEFGHRVRRVSESDVEIGLRATEEEGAILVPRPPVVTIMGHVDHGKTSLLDALRQTDVVSGEAGGITQHIGAYQVQLESGSRITFIDTPGHAAFTEMRARGANVTDVVVLVVAANDGVMPQTIEAIRHAKAAKVPIIVAINKCDLPDARPERVRQELLQHELVVEEMGGDVLDVEVSAKAKLNLHKLEEAILLQAEILELRANPERAAEGVVIEAKLERGRGSVATVLVQRGTLKVGDVFVTGAEWGRVRALINDRGQNVNEAAPAVPVEVLGLNGTPMAGDDFTVVESEARAREIAEFRQRKKREAVVAASARGSLQDMFSRIQAGEAKELPVVIKGDVQGSIEAIASSLEKLTAENTEVKVRVLHNSVGAINESDITLANASNAMIIGFNVRANPQARDLAKRDGVEIRYYSIIYNVIDDVKAALTGLLSPTLRERFIGYATIREVFNITKVGKVAGCMVTQGTVKRGAGVRLLRDNVVIHEGTLKTLKRFKDEVKEVREGYECGMAFENYDNIQAGDQIEAFEIEEIAREL